MRRTQDQWQQLIDEQMQSGMSAAEFCRKRRLNAKYFSLRKSKSATRQNSTELPSGFIRVNTTNEPNSSPYETALVQVYHGQTRLTFPAQCPAAWVADFVKALSR